MKSALRHLSLGEIGVGSGLFLLELVYTGVGTLAPGLILGHSIRARKEEQMAALQRRLDDLVPRMEELSEREFRLLIDMASRSCYNKRVHACRHGLLHPLPGRADL